MSTYSMAAVNTDGSYEYLLNKDVNFIRQSYPNPNDDKSKSASEMHSIGKAGGHHSSGDDDDGEMDDDDGDGLDEITNLNQQQELRRELIVTIEEALREQEALKRHNEELQRQIMLMDPSIYE